MQCPTTSLFRNTLSGFMFAEMTTNTEMLHNFAISLDYKNSLKEFHFMIPLFFILMNAPIYIDIDQRKTMLVRECILVQFTRPFHQT